MSEERKKTIEELGKLIREKGGVQALSVVSAFAAGYEAATEAAKTKIAADDKPEVKAESEAKAG